MSTFEELAAKAYKDWEKRMTVPLPDSSAKRALKALGFKVDKKKGKK
jgi:hypothetical protein